MFRDATEMKNNFCECLQVKGGVAVLQNQRSHSIMICPVSQMPN